MVRIPIALIIFAAFVIDIVQTVRVLRLKRRVAELQAENAALTEALARP